MFCFFFIYWSVVPLLLWQRFRWYPFFSNNQDIRVVVNYDFSYWELKIMFIGLGGRGYDHESRDRYDRGFHDSCDKGRSRSRSPTGHIN